MIAAITNGYNYLIENNLSIRLAQNVDRTPKLCIHTS